MTKLILSDADGCMVDWEGDFKRWMQSQGHRLKYSDSYKLHHHFHELEDQQIDRYVNDFCASDAIADLSPLLDAQEYIEKLYKQHDYRFRVITSIGTDPETIARRERNLNDLFGDAIESVICLEAGSPKDLILEPYRGSGLFWIEDRDINAIAGADRGLNSLLISHPYNRNFKYPGVSLVTSWAEIYSIIAKTNRRLRDYITF